MIFLIRLIGAANGAKTSVDGQFLTGYEGPEDEQGYAQIHTSPRRTEAKRFSSVQEAVEFWQQQSRTIPLRPDGMPNRPLTAFHAEISMGEE